jgi:Arc/MetJ family transcription regulator
MYNIYEGDDTKMRTTLNISEDLIKETESIYNAKSKSEMVEMALKDAIRFKKMQKLIDLKGNIDFDEKYVKLTMLSYLMLSRVYYVKSEYEVEDGYIDIALLERSGVDPDYEAIIELKYIKKSEYGAKGEAIVDDKLEEAKEQLLKYKQADELRARQNLKKIVLIFVGAKCVKQEEIE